MNVLVDAAVPFPSYTRPASHETPCLYAYLHMPTRITFESRTSYDTKVEGCHNSSPAGLSPGSGGPSLPPLPWRFSTPSAPKPGPITPPAPAVPDAPVLPSLVGLKISRLLWRFNLPFMHACTSSNLSWDEQAAVVRVLLQKIAHLDFLAFWGATASAVYGLHMLKWKWSTPAPNSLC